MAKKDIVVVGASAGGMQALEAVAAGLPPDLHAAVFVVWHLAPGVRSMLPVVLSRASGLPAAYPQDGDPIEPGRIYVAPNDHHLLLERGYVRVAKGPKDRMVSSFGGKFRGCNLRNALIVPNPSRQSGLWEAKDEVLAVSQETALAMRMVLFSFPRRGRPRLTEQSR